jgi:hypothetical protein
VTALPHPPTHSFFIFKYLNFRYHQFILILINIFCRLTVAGRVQVCYFLLPDRFSDGKESERELFKAERATEFARPKTETKEWAESAMQWQGGSLRGIIGQLAYLKARRTVRLRTVPVL